MGLTQESSCSFDLTCTHFLNNTRLPTLHLFILRSHQRRRSTFGIDHLVPFFPLHPIHSTRVRVHWSHCLTVRSGQSFEHSGTTGCSQAAHIFPVSRSENHTMTSQKRDRDVELDNESAASTPTNKRTRYNKSGSADHRTDHPNVHDNSLLIVWSQPMTEQQKSFLTEKMEGWITFESAVNLIKPHTGERMTLDAKKIQRPMDLSTMGSYLDSGKYSAVRDLVLDFRLMIGNVFRICSWTQKESLLALRLFPNLLCGNEVLPDWTSR
jgi:hypothetical protein